VPWIYNSFFDSGFSAVIFGQMQQCSWESNEGVYDRKFSQTGDIRMLTQVRSNKQVKSEGNELGALWLALMDGDQEGVSELFCVFYPTLFNYGYKIIPNEAFIKDTIQELFLRLWEKRASISGAESVKAYLFTSLRRLIFRKLEQRDHQIERNHRYQNNMFEDIYNIEELMIHFETDREEKDQLTRAMQSLNERQREAIYLKFYDGLSSAEIARVMGINIQSVYNHVSEAIQEMQEFVDGSEKVTK
jgi:RNA polymerase sigma factor (sigma-70 family)